jgi:hypothetical protein
MRQQALRLGMHLSAHALLVTDHRPEGYVLDASAVPPLVFHVGEGEALPALIPCAGRVHI